MQEFDKPKNIEMLLKLKSSIFNARPQMANYNKENKPKYWMSEKEIQNCLGKVPAQSWVNL